MSAAPTRDPELGALVARFALPGAARDKLARLLHMMLEDPLAPTAIKDRRRAFDDHLADSLVAVELPEVRSASCIADLGSGAGLPGLPLAVALPESEVYLVESNSRKAQFARRAAAACRIDNAHSVPARAEDWPEGMSRFDLVTARALAPLEVVAEYAAPLLRPGGVLVAWRGRREPEAEARAAVAAEVLGLSVGEVRAVSPYPRAENRHLHLMSKVRQTPQRFPRRPGAARKRPLGSQASSDRTRR